MLKRFKNLAKKYALPFLAAAGLSLTACNNNSVPVCSVNPAVEYAESLGYSNPEVFSPLGEDCDIDSGRDKEFIRFLIKNGIDPGPFVDRFGREDAFGKNYRISGGEMSAIFYAKKQHDLLVLDGVLPEDSKFSAEEVKALIFPFEYSLLEGIISSKRKYGSSFPEVSLAYDGKEKNFMNLPGVLMDGSSDVCPDLVELPNQGYDFVFNGFFNENNIPVFVNNTFYPLKVSYVVDEGTSYNDKHTYSISFELTELDSSLFPYKPFFSVAHMYFYSDGVMNHPPAVGEVFDPWYYDEDGNLHLPQKKLFVNYTLPGSDGSSNVNFDYNVDSTDNKLGFEISNTSKGTIYVNEVMLPKNFYPPGYVPYDSVGFVGHVSRNYSSPIFSNNKIVGYDISVLVSPGSEVDPNDLDRIVCKYYSK